MEFPSNFKPHPNGAYLAETVDNSSAGTSRKFRVFYLGDFADGADPQFVTSTTVASFYLNYGTGAVKDTAMGTAGDYTYGASETVAEFQAAVFAQSGGRWLVVQESCLPTDVVKSLIIAIVADNANAIACRSTTGTIVYSLLGSTNECNQVCIGVQAFPAIFGGTPGAQMVKTARTEGGLVDVAAWPPAGMVYATENLCAWIDTLTLAGTGATAPYYIYACTDSSARLLTPAGVLGSAVALTGLGLMTRPGERIVVKLGDRATALADPIISFGGGVGSYGN